jgi:hypothetical protein
MNQSYSREDSKIYTVENTNRSHHPEYIKSEYSDKNKYHIEL